MSKPCLAFVGLSAAGPSLPSSPLLPACLLPPLPLCSPLPTNSPPTSGRSPAGLGAAYIIARRRRRAALAVAATDGAAAPQGGDPEKGGACQVSTSCDSLSSWSSASGAEKRADTNGRPTTSGPPSSSAGSSGVRRSSTPGGSPIGPAAAAAAGGWVAVPPLARLDTSHSLPRRQSSALAGQGSPRVFRQDSSTSAISAKYSPSKVYRQPNGPASTMAGTSSPARHGRGEARGSDGRVLRQGSLTGSFSSRSYTQPIGGIGGIGGGGGGGGSGNGTPKRSLSKPHSAVSGGGGSRSLGRQFSQGSEQGGAKDLAAAGSGPAGGTVTNPLWKSSSLPSPLGGAWTDNPLSAMDAEAGDVAAAVPPPAQQAAQQPGGFSPVRLKSSSSSGSLRLPAVSE